MNATDGTLGAPAHLYPPISGLPHTGLYKPAQWVEPGAAPGEPPVVRGTDPVLLPKVDPDGNTLAGIHLPLIETSRATYTAWNPTRGVAADTLCNQKGGVLTFPDTRAAAKAAKSLSRGTRGRSRGFPLRKPIGRQCR